MRIQVEVNDSRGAALRKLKEKCDFRSYTEFFNNAATLLQWVVSQIENERAILSEDAEGNVRELSMPFMEHIISTLPAHPVKTPRVKVHAG